jgi:hypothetical protein
METKLTLRMDEKIIETAKIHAQKKVLANFLSI